MGRRRPLDLTQEEAEEALDHWKNLDERVFEQVHQLLKKVSDQNLRTQLRAVAFEPNEALPKRDYRPNRSIFHLSEQLLSTNEIRDQEQRDAVLQLSLLVAEYYDIFDDLIDQDVNSEHREEVIATWQMMHPLTVRLLQILGSEVVEFWSERTVRLMGAPLAGIHHDPTLEVYEEIVDLQSNMFGCLTAIPALLNNREETIVRCEELLGRKYYKFDQYLLDGEQLNRDCSSNDTDWNIWALESPDNVLDRLSQLRREIYSNTDHLSEEKKAKIGLLIDIDLEEWWNDCT